MYKNTFTKGPGGSYRSQCVKVCERPCAEQFKCLHMLGGDMVFISHAGRDYCEQARKNGTSDSLYGRCREEGKRI